MIASLLVLRSKNLVPILIFYYLVGITGIIVPATRNLFIRLTPFSLLMSIFLLFLFHDNYKRRFWLASLLIFSIGFLVEVVGVKTGILFGAYQYGETLGLKLMHTPLLIGVNWLMLIYCATYIAGKYVEPLYYRSIVAATLMVVYDFALEPAAIRLDMWSWSGGAVPLQNYLAWFIIAFGLSYLAGRLHLVPRQNKLAFPLFFIQMLFFIMLDLWIVLGVLWD
jgi:putative membrane protein